MTSLASKLSDIVGAAFVEQGLDAALGAVRVSDRPDLCQFQCNGAMAAAKVAKKNPRENAQSVVEALAGQDGLENVEIAGPGFINIDVSDDFIKSHLSSQAADRRLNIADIGQNKTVIIDYGGMNVAKAMHVGHLRSLAIGDCIKKMLNFAGYDGLGDIHMGDWGLQMGQIISEFEIRHPEWPYFDPDFDGEYPKDAPFDYAELQQIYPEASQACKEDADRLERARTATMELQDGRRGYRALWQHFIDLSISDIKSNIVLLDVDFEIWKGEASVNDLIPEVTKDLADKNVTVDSDGAVVIPVEEDGDKKEMPPLIFLKSNGAATYGTTDVATIYDRIQSYPNLTKMIYETDLRQNLHFEQLFRAVKKAGYVDDIELKHIGHGTVNGPDGKPFKTREGKAMKFADMIETVMMRAAQRLDEADLASDMSDDERADVARKVAVSVLKFTELSNQPHQDYIFDIDRMSAFEGKTGPYLLYQAVRIQSLLKKAEYDVSSASEFLIADEDRSLALFLCELPDHFEAALKHYSPHILCDYAYRLAQEFSAFYSKCHILSEKDAAVRASRLALCALTHRQLVFVLGLLGMNVPERM